MNGDSLDLDIKIEMDENEDGKVTSMSSNKQSK